MNDEELIEELRKKELEIITQAEYEFDTNLVTKLDKDIQQLGFINQTFATSFKQVARFSFINGARFGFLKYIENFLEKK